MPANITADALRPGGATITYTAPTAADEDAKAPTVSCDPASGSTFPVGTTTVHCSASDADDLNNQVTASFMVTVRVAYCVVSNVKGKTLARAKRAITAARCSVGGIKYARSRAKKGIVVAQSPQPGSELEVSEVVNLVVSRGRPR